MDGSRFDSLTRTLAERPSRRRVLGAMVGAAAAGLASAAGRGVDAAGRCKTVGQVCKTTADCCPIENNNWCDTALKKPVCKTCAGTVCGGTCVDTTSNSGHCGGCGTVCTGGSTCVNGGCRCGAFQHRDDTGACTCVGTSCPHPEFGDDVREFCCPDFVCDPDTDQCRACSPRYGTCGYTLPGGFGQDPALCCGDQQCLNGVCYTKCADDADCDTAGGEFCCDRFAVCLTDATACN